VSLFTAPSFAQTLPSTRDGSVSQQELLDRLAQLEKRVSELEQRDRQLAAMPACSMERSSNGANLPQASAVGQAHEDHPLSPNPAVQEHEQHASTQAEVRAAEIHYPSLQIRGFGDVDFSATDQPNTHGGFNLGQFVLHFASPLSPKVSYFGEVSLTAQPSGYAAQVERTIIRYDYNDYFKLSFGKYHTPISYWNNTFHHGAWLQTTISRPEMVQIGGTFIPVHFVGLLAEGNIPSGGAGLAYQVGLGNGRSNVLSTASDAGDVNSKRAWLATVYARPSWLYGLDVGGGVYHDNLNPQSGGTFEEWITSAHLVWTKERPEFISEFANAQHRDLQTSQTFNSQALYVQLAYRFHFNENKWKPYYRFEYIHKPGGDRVFTNVSDLTGSTVGVRYDITTYAAFKGEYRHGRNDLEHTTVNGTFFQTAFTF
jgi:hypothetical protein